MCPGGMLVHRKIGKVGMYCKLRRDTLKLRQQQMSIFQCLEQLKVSLWVPNLL